MHYDNAYCSSVEMLPTTWWTNTDGVLGTMLPRISPPALYFSEAS